MYKTNLRDIRFPTENAPVILQKGLITKEDFTHSDTNVTLYQTPYAIAKRIFVWTDIEVLTTEWTQVGNSDYPALEKAYSNIHVENPAEESTIVDGEPEYEDISMVESAPEIAEEPIAEQEAEEVISEEAPIEVEQPQEEIVEEPEFHEDGEPAPEVVDEQPVETEEIAEESAPTQESEPVAVPVTPVQQNNNQNYTRINNKRNKHNRH
jgi:hypothetical protein